MENFDETIKEYATKLVDKENNAVVKYDWRRKPRTDIHRVISDISDSETRKQITAEHATDKVRKVFDITIETPHGTFKSAAEAADACNISVVSLYLWIRKEKPGYSKRTVQVKFRTRTRTKKQ